MTSAKPLCRVLWNLIALVILAQALSACSTTRVVEQPCPAPAGSTLVPPKPLPQITGASLTLQEAIRLWLDDIEQYNLNAKRHAALIEWGVAQCKWPQITPSAVPATATESEVAVPSS